MTTGKATPFSFLQLLTIYLSRENVQPIVSRVHEASYQSCPTYEKAEEFYLDAKRDKKVKFVRNPGDEMIFGPEEDAIQ